MILSEIKSYLQTRKQATLTDIANHFDADPSAIEGMLEQWIRKGKIKKVPLTDSCGSSCNKCDSGETAFYVWHDAIPEQRVEWLPPVCKG